MIAPKLALSLVILFSVPSMGASTELMVEKGVIWFNKKKISYKVSIKSGDVIGTGNKSGSTIKVKNFGVFDLDPNTLLKFSSVYNKNNSRVDLVKGNIIAIIQRRGSHKLKINAAELTIQGQTTLAVKSKKDMSQLSLYEGQVAIQSVPSGDMKKAPNEEFQNMVLVPEEKNPVYEIRGGTIKKADGVRFRGMKKRLKSLQAQFSKKKDEK